MTFHTKSTTALHVMKACPQQAKETNQTFDAQPSAELTIESSALKSNVTLALGSFP